nr:H517 [uncultured bacterium]
MSNNFRMAAGDWLALRRLFRSSFRPGLPPEVGALGVFGSVTTMTGTDFLLARLFMPEEGDIAHASNGSLVFSSSYVRRAHLYMREKGLRGIASFHTHPLSTTHVSFSWYDDEQDPELAENLAEIAPKTSLLSVVVGRESQSGRFWSAPRDPLQLDELILVGDHLDYLPLTGQPAPAPPPPAALFDRGLSLTGSGALARLSSSQIAVVGSSGTGSLMAELLIRAGCKNLLLIDDDFVQDVNLNRILYATIDDAVQGTPKVEVLKRGLDSLGFEANIQIICGSVLEDENLLALRGAAIVIGCVDRAYPRRLLSQLSFQYLLPYIDVGTEIGGDDAGIVSLDSRLNLVAPHRPCLLCTGLVTPRALNLESMSYEEQQRNIAQGYSEDLLIKQPAVMDLNMRASSAGMLILRHMLQPFLNEPLPITLSENMVTFRMIASSTARAVNPYCRICQKREFMGFGDQGPRIGLDGASAGRFRASRS